MLLLDLCNDLLLCVGGLVAGYFLGNKLVWYFSSREKYYFLRKENASCQLCFAKSVPNCCGLKTCSFALIREVIQLVKKSKTRVDFCSPCIQIDIMGQALIKTAARGVQVRVITGSGISVPNIMKEIMKAGIPTRTLDPAIDSSVMMHNKFIVIDEKILIRSSLNWTYKCLQGNYENLQILRDSTKVTWYGEYFAKMWDPNHHIHPDKKVLELLRRGGRSLR